MENIVNWNELEKDFKTNKDRLIKQDFIKLEYARLYSQHENEIMSHKDNVGITKVFFKDNREIAEYSKMSPIYDYCTREALLGLIVENNKRLLSEIESLLHKNES